MTAWCSNGPAKVWRPASPSPLPCPPTVAGCGSRDGLPWLAAASATADALERARGCSVQPGTLSQSRGAIRGRRCCKCFSFRPHAHAARPIVPCPHSGVAWAAYLPSPCRSPRPRSQARPSDTRAPPCSPIASSAVAREARRTDRVPRVQLLQRRGGRPPCVGGAAC